MPVNLCLIVFTDKTGAEFVKVVSEKDEAKIIANAPTDIKTLLEAIDILKDCIEKEIKRCGDWHDGSAALKKMEELDK